MRCGCSFFFYQLPECTTPNMDAQYEMVNEAQPLCTIKEAIHSFRSLLTYTGSRIR